MDRLSTAIAAAVCILATAVLPAHAGWVARTADDGALFYGLAIAEGTGFAVRCNGPSRQGLPPVSVGAHEEARTQPFHLIFSLRPELLAVPETYYQRGDVVVWSGATGYRLPVTTWNELDGEWQAEVAMTDALPLSLMTANDLIVGAEAGPHTRITIENMNQSVAEAMAFCVAEYRRAGLTAPSPLDQYWPGADNSVLYDDTGPGSPDAMVDYARAHISNGCSGAAQIEEGAILLGEIDGDGVEDAVLNWGRVTCSQGLARPFCGASMCSADVYLSSAYGRRGGPFGLLALGVDLLPLTNGLQGVSVGGSLSMCNAAGQGSGGCRFIWYWNGADLVELK
ncbi:hypothetical protein [uncultured Tateyamaria sp.]|uniref:hypothetical protein n=1 Tax=uncultured Tateyamaria sp. TaxID=455651 RepID=UPI002637B5CC|nr:hypothetical protein [uncultured Tateyamaria sp.]